MLRTYKLSRQPIHHPTLLEAIRRSSAELSRDATARRRSPDGAGRVGQQPGDPTHGRFIATA